MVSLIVVRIKKIRYAGKSIGRDIRLDMQLPEGKQVRIEKKIKPNSELSLDNELINYIVGSDPFELPIKLTITELDAIQSDTNYTQETFFVPTEADHYHDDSATKQSWMKPEYFKKKIGPFSFYDVP